LFGLFARKFTLLGVPIKAESKIGESLSGSSNKT